MYSEISLKSPIFNGYENNENSLRNISKINILIGKNNSGKSRFLRKVFAEDKVQYKTNSFNLLRINEILDLLKEKSKHYSEHSDYHNYRQLFHPFLKANMEFITMNSNLRLYESSIQEIIRFYEDLNNNPHLKYSVREEFKPLFEEYENLIEEAENKLNFQRIYIPTLRGLRPVQLKTDGSFSQESDNYSSRNIKDYFKDFTTRKEDIFTGLDFYNRATSLLLGTIEDRQKFRDFENFLKDVFFENSKTFSIVPRIKDDVIHVYIDESERPIYELGDGIQSIIILVYPLFFNLGNATVFFFEEPETHLHPGLQRIFIEALQREEFSSYQYFISTHSNHFLDLTLEYDNISVYSFSKNNEIENSTYLIENVEYGKNNILEMLGARASSVFLSNCTIWVEGITDRIYLRKFLEIYQNDKKKKFREDYHYSFVEYGGNNITHWSFLEDESGTPKIEVERLCSKLFLITDNDGAGLKINGEESKEPSKQKKYQRHIKLQEKLQERYYCLNCREIENLLTLKIIKKTIIAHQIKNKSLDFTKFDKMSNEEFQDKQLGKFLDEKIDGSKKKYNTDSGTLNNKVIFSKLSTSKITGLEDLSPEAIKICEKLYKFIEVNNKNK